jgi:hypothetical protein
VTDQEFDIMNQEMREKDWKIFRELHDITLDRFCDRVLSEVTEITSDRTRGSHERYLQLFKRLRERDDELATVFATFRRSQALTGLAAMRVRNLVTDEEYSRFSDETREKIDRWLQN